MPTAQLGLTVPTLRVVLSAVLLCIHMMAYKLRTDQSKSCFATAYSDRYCNRFCRITSLPLPETLSFNLTHENDDLLW